MDSLLQVYGAYKGVMKLFAALQVIYRDRMKDFCMASSLDRIIPRL